MTDEPDAYPRRSRRGRVDPRCYRRSIDATTEHAAWGFRTGAWPSALAIALGLVAWQMLTAWAAFAFGYPVFPRGWPAIGVQAASTALGLLPLLALHPAPRPRAPRRIPLALGVAVLVATAIAAAQAHAVRALPLVVCAALLAGVSEELVFRGVVWDALRTCVGATERKKWARLAAELAVLLASSGLFAAFHLPRILAVDDGLGTLVALFGWGACFGVLRLASGRIGLPMACHVALDLL